jgi:hypothetical protein
MELALVAITQAGELAQPVPSMPPIAAAVVEATVQLYRVVGYEPPWVGYLAFENGICVGSCGFKSPPQDNRVEIAYFTFPGHEQARASCHPVTEERDPAAIYMSNSEGDIWT